MKRFVTILIAILMIVSTLTACNNSSSVSCVGCGYKNLKDVKFCSNCGAMMSSQTVNSGTSNCSHAWNDATCDTPKTCSKCGETSGSALGHTTTTGICSRCNQNFGEWEIDYYVDEFNNPTNQKYITNKKLIAGTFSNSATNDSLLYAKILVDNNDGIRVSIILYEYGKNQVKASHESTYSITLLDTNKTKHNLKGIMYDNGDRVRLYVSSGGTDYIMMFIDSMLESGTISLYMVESKYVKSEYLFNINTSNFAELYYELAGNISNNSNSNNNNNSNNNTGNDDTNTNSLDYELIDNGNAYRVTGIGTYDSSNLIIPDEYNGKPVTEIRDIAFYGCNLLTNLTIGNNVRTIGDAAFCACESLKTITISNSVTNIVEGAFSCCTSLTSITVNEGNQYYKSIAGNLYSKDGTKFIQYSTGKTNASFVIPEGVAYIGNNAFNSCHSLTSITIPNSVISIGDLAFTCTSLTNVIVPDGVIHIGEYAFAMCNSLVSITLPVSVKTIGNGAFSYCGLLASINYKGSAEQWNLVNKGQDWDSDTGNYKIYYI